MTGHVRRRGERSFELKYDVGVDPLTGKRRIRYASFKGTKRAAEIELARLIADNAAGHGTDPVKTTVASFLATWLSDWAQANVGAQTWQQYDALSRYVIANIGAVPIQKLRPAHLQSLYATLLRSGGRNGRPLSALTVGHVHRLLHRVFGHAQVWGIIATNVASAVSPPRLSHREITILTEDEIAHLLNHLEGHELRPLVCFLLGTGARRAEAMALTWEAVDLERGVVLIKAALAQTIRHGVQVKAPKSRAGVRSVTLSAWLTVEMRAHRARQQEQRMALGLGRMPDKSPVFGRWDGSWRTPNSVTAAWARLADAAGVPDVTLHALRHTHASQLIAAGVDVVTIAKRLGHGNPAITLGVYSHMFRNTDQAAADASEAMFRKVTQ
jgi:integrase